LPDFVQLGFEILAFSSFRSKRSKEIAEGASRWTESKPNVLFAPRAEGVGKNATVVSIHKDYAEYSTFVSEILMEGEGILEKL